jgi:dihydroneopterin aldolase
MFSMWYRESFLPHSELPHQSLPTSPEKNIRYLCYRTTVAVKTMPSALVTSWKVRALAGEPSSTIRVGNLQVFVTGPHDAWGRSGRPQPATVSVEVGMSKPFSTSSSQDAVEADTVHYGFLSKKIQEVLDSVQHDPEAPLSLAGMVQLIWEQLTGYYLLKDATAPNTGTSFLKKGSFRYLKIDMKLPKASLAGNGVSYTASAFMGDQDSPRAEAASVKIHHLRVPTLIGVNSNERQAKQTVIANIEIDKWIGSADEYSRIEALVTKVRHICPQNHHEQAKFGCGSLY